MWYVAHDGSLLNLSQAQRVYIDDLGRLVASFFVGDVVILPAGVVTIATITATLAAIRAIVSPVGAAP